VQRIAASIAAAGLLTAGVAHAMTATTVDFRGNATGTLPSQGLTTVELTPEGLYVRTDTDGFIQLPPPSGHADSLALTVTNASTPDIALLWRTADLGAGEYYQADVDLPVGQSKEADLALTQFPEWEWSAPTIGLAFPAGAEVLIEKMEWRSYSPLEKAWNGFVSFWTPDRFTLYSINFLWGPLIGTTPEARATLFASLPPKAWSATWLFYGAFAVAAAGGAAWAWKKPDARRRFLLVLAAGGAALWILFDARMTLEIFRYAVDDWRTYVLAPADERTLRTHANLYDVIAKTKELLGDDGTYVLLAPSGTPFFANVRYALYPAVPVPPESGSGTAAWIVLGEPDVVERNGELMRTDGTVLSPPGAVVERFDANSYFFRATP
jgi:hypothetical protein